jgi:hypothetical protein
VSFQGLEPDTRYRVQCYALADPDYNNKLNIKASDSGTLLAGNMTSTDYALFGVDENGINTNTSGTPANNVYGKNGLYEKYFGIENPTEASALVTSNSDKLLYEAYSGYESSAILITESAAITTLASGELGTVGTVMSNDVSVNIKDNALTIPFQDAYGLQNLVKCEYQLGKTDSAGNIVARVTGSVAKQEGQESIMMANATYGKVNLKLTDQNFALESGQNYYLKMVFYYEVEGRDPYKESVTIPIGTK